MPRSRPGGAPALTIVIPAYNEAERIAPTLEAYAEEFGQRAELLVVLNGCTDRTASVVAGVQQRYPEVIRLVDIPEPIGKGGAVKRGMLMAAGQAIGFVDADGATRPQEFRRLSEKLRQADGVIASRWLPGSEVYNRSSLLRRVASRTFRLITKTMFHLPYADTQCGAKIFRRKVIETVAAKLQITNMAFDVELLMRARAAGFRVIEEPTVWTDYRTVLSSPTKFVTTSLSVFRSLLLLQRLVRQEGLSL